MDRKEVEDWMREAEAGYQLRLPAPVIAALCRTQLAVWDAPRARLVGHGTSWKGGGCTELTLEGVHHGFELLREHWIVPEGA